MMNEQKWLLCDMHMHSHYSRINKKSEKDRVKEMPASEFVETLKNKKVEVFSITDHNYFSSDYFNSIQKYIEDNNIKMSIIPGVEFDVYINDVDYIHICFYFSRNINCKDLEEKVKLLYDTSGEYGGKPKINNIINSLFSLKTKMIIIPHGDKGTNRGLFNVLNKIEMSKSEDFYKYAMYKIFNAYDVKPSFYETSISHWAANFYDKTKQFNNIIENLDENEIESLKASVVNRIKDSKFELNNIEKEVYDYVMNYGSYFCYFSFSDWHNAEEYNPVVNNFIFGSLNNSFESFELATLDPESRIQLCKEDYIGISDDILKEVSFKINGKEKRVEFSPGLNAVVGKRGSGKSLLISCIRNLTNINDEMGALSHYKKLNIEDIKGVNRGNISISLGSLNSCVFLSQDAISNIFENPEKAEEQVASNFVDPTPIDLSSLKEISTIAKGIIPYDNNYKNVTNNISLLKKENDYSLHEYDFDTKNIIKTYFESILTNLNNIRTNLDEININSNEIIEVENRIRFLKNKYTKMISLYNSFISESNKIIENINNSKSSNDRAIRQNKKSLEDAKKVIFDNFDRKLNLEKLRYIMSNFSFSENSIAIKRKNRFIFASYYEIPDNLSEEITASITKAIFRSQSFDDIDSYINGTNNKKLNSSASDLSHYLDEYINGDVFKNKKTFYEINDTSIDYESLIKTKDDLDLYVKNKKLTDLSSQSLGTKSVAYLDMLFNLEENILVFDQPEDNIDNDYISNYLVPNIKNNKKIKQLIFVTHNPTVAVYGDAFNYIFAENKGEISYYNYFIENYDDKEKILKILEGGKGSFSNRNKKYGNVLGEEEYEN